MDFLTRWKRYESSVILTDALTHAPYLNHVKLNIYALLMHTMYFGTHENQTFRHKTQVNILVSNETSEPPLSNAYIGSIDLERFMQNHYIHLKEEALKFRLIPKHSNVSM